jgi:hypothetical protein
VAVSVDRRVVGMAFGSFRSAGDDVRSLRVDDGDVVEEPAPVKATRTVRVLRIGSHPICGDRRAPPSRRITSPLR